DIPINTVYSVSIPITLQVAGGAEPFAYEILTPPSHGSLSGTAPNLVYEPELGFEGLDSFTYQVMDANGFSDTATVSLTITSDLAAVGIMDSVPYSASIPITLEATGGVQPYTFEVLPADLPGILTGTPPNLTFEPDANYTGPFTFSFRVTDA